MICVTADDPVLAAEGREETHGNWAFRRCREVLQVIDVSRACARGIRPYKETPPCTSGPLKSLENSGRDRSGWPFGAPHMPETAP